jgi:hypothetical protein
VVNERIEERRAGRILAKKKLPKVNKKLAEKISEQSKDQVCHPSSQQERVLIIYLGGRHSSG